MTGAITDWSGINGVALIGPAIGLFALVVALGLVLWGIWWESRNR